MSLLDYGLLALLALGAGLALRSIRRQRRRGGGCCGDCARCGKTCK